MSTPKTWSTQVSPMGVPGEAQGLVACNHFRELKLTTPFSFTNHGFFTIGSGSTSTVTASSGYILSGNTASLILQDNTCSSRRDQHHGRQRFR
jgi:hypothetical protein